MKHSVMQKLLSAALVVVMLCALMLTAGAEGAIDTILQTGTTQAFKPDAVNAEDLNTILQAGLSAASAINQQPWYFVALTNPEIMAELSGGAPAGNAAPAGDDMGPSSGAPAGGDMGPSDGAPAGDGMGASSGAPAGGDMGASSGAPAGDNGMGASSGASAAPAASSAKAGLGDSPVAIIVYMNEDSSSPNPDFDCGLACQNIVIAASALGYGTKIISSPTMTLNGEKHDAICQKLGVDPALKAVAVILIGYPDADVDGATGATVRDAIEDKVSFVN